MSERLTDDELDALIQRFRPERHPKVAVALEELKDRRLDEARQNPVVSAFEVALVLDDRYSQSREAFQLCLSRALAGDMEAVDEIPALCSTMMQEAAR